MTISSKCFLVLTQFRCVCPGWMEQQGAKRMTCSSSPDYVLPPIIRAISLPRKNRIATLVTLPYNIEKGVHNLQLS